MWRDSFLTRGLRFFSVKHLGNMKHVWPKFCNIRQIHHLVIEPTTPAEPLWDPFHCSLQLLVGLFLFLVILPVFFSIFKIILISCFYFICNNNCIFTCFFHITYFIFICVFYLHYRYRAITMISFRVFAVVIGNAKIDF